MERRVAPAEDVLKVPGLAARTLSSTSKTSRLPRLVSDLTENHPNLTKAYDLLLQSNNCDLSEHIAFLHLSIYLHDTRSTQIILILGVEHKRVGPGGHRVANLITYNHP